MFITLKTVATRVPPNSMVTVYPLTPPNVAINAPALNNLIRNALDEHPPRTHKGRRLKILYATQARSPVPTIVLFVNDPELMHFAYQRYLENRIRAVFGFAGVRLRIVTRHRDESDD